MWGAERMAPSKGDAWGKFGEREWRYIIWRISGGRERRWHFDVGMIDGMMV